MWQDYTGQDVNVDNLFAVILGNKTALKGGSGKVVDSGPNDHIFIYYSDHGGPGVLGEFYLVFFFFVSHVKTQTKLMIQLSIGMPTSPALYANDLNDVLKKKHASGTYKSLVQSQESSENALLLFYFFGLTFSIFWF